MSVCGIHARILLAELVVAGVVGAPFLLSDWAMPRAAAQTETRPAYDARAHDVLEEIHVDQNCRLLPDPNELVKQKGKPKLKKDEAICHIETVAHSEHPEQSDSDGVRRKTSVEIREQTFVLQNVWNAPVIFVVEQAEPKDWFVDSDPQPVEVVPQEKGSGKATAVFRVNAQPGEMVRLHVGLRRTRVLSTKPL